MTYLQITMVTNDIMEPAPWPLIIETNPEGISGLVIHGRPDALNLIGFANPKTPLRVAFFAERLVNEPDLAIGLCPVYADGIGIFAVPTNVATGVTEYHADGAAIAQLVEQNSRSRMALAAFAVDTLTNT